MYKKDSPYNQYPTGWRKYFRGQHINSPVREMAYELGFTALKVFALYLLVKDQDDSSFRYFFNVLNYGNIIKNNFCKSTTSSTLDNNNGDDYYSDGSPPTYFISYLKNCLNPAVVKDHDDAPPQAEYIEISADNCYHEVPLSAIQSAECDGLSYTMGWLVGIAITLATAHSIHSLIQRSCFSGIQETYKDKNVEDPTTKQSCSSACNNFVFTKAEYSAWILLSRTLMDVGLFIFAISTFAMRVSKSELAASDCLTRVAACNYALNGDSIGSPGVMVNETARFMADPGQDHGATNMQIAMMVSLVALPLLQGFGIIILRKLSQCCETRSKPDGANKLLADRAGEHNYGAAEEGHGAGDTGPGMQLVARGQQTPRIN
jgi:hypothetical protein